jgi:GT2 family glycosyltransferase
MVLFSRHDLYERIGGFDESFARAKYEDEGMSWRLRQAGLEAAVTLAVVVHHHGSRTVREERKQAPGFEAVNTRYFDRKWRHAWHRRKAWKLARALRRALWRARGGMAH